MELEYKRPKLEKSEHFPKSLESNCNDHLVNLYKTVPFAMLTLEECQDLFRQRLEAYSVIDKHSKEMKGKAESRDEVYSMLRNIKPHSFKRNCIMPDKSNELQRKQDRLSHMLTRMYCVYNPTLWDWFIKHEKSLLYYTLRDQGGAVSGKRFETILKEFNFSFERVQGTELHELMKDNTIGWNSQSSGAVVDIFKVKFIAALRFIANRTVALKDGFAFLTRYEIISVVCDAFEKYLEKELKYAQQHFDLDRLQTQFIIESLHMVYSDFLEKNEAEKRRLVREQQGESYNPYRIDVNNLGELSKKHYPPCMRYIHESLLADHHLKHQGRLIYGTFLRSGGVEMEEAIEFWRREFTKKIPNEKFERDYKYNIRHLYGREGHKKALSCFSCDKIINDNAPGPTEKHGCPFKHFDETHLKDMLKKQGFKEVDIESINAVAAEKQYKLACTHYFKFSRGSDPTEPIKSPIHFYMESMRLANRPPPKEERGEEIETLNQKELINEEEKDAMSC